MPIHLELTEAVQAVLQKMVEEKDHWQRVCGNLRSENGENRGDCIHAFLRSEPLAWYLMRLKDTGDPCKALTAAKEQANLICARANYRREREVCIDPWAYFRGLEAWHVKLLNAAEV